MGYRPQSPDTTRDAERLQFAVYRRMTAAEKLERVRSLSRLANQLALEGLRRRHRGEDETSLTRRLVVMRLGPALAERILSAADA